MEIADACRRKAGVGIETCHHFGLGCSWFPMSSLMSNPHPGQQFQVNMSFGPSPLSFQSCPHFGQKVSGLRSAIRVNNPPKKNVPNPIAETPPNIIESRSIGFWIIHIPSPTTTPSMNHAATAQPMRVRYFSYACFTLATVGRNCESIFCVFIWPQ